VSLARVCIVGYFLFFLTLPFYSGKETTARVPQRVKFHD
jgi:hypothetical protein